MRLWVVTERGFGYKCVFSFLSNFLFHFLQHFLQNFLSSFLYIFSAQFSVKMLILGTNEPSPLHFTPSNLQKTPVFS